MKDLHIIVSNKVATYLSRDGDIVCGNSDYRIVFTFDSEWDGYDAKTARFFWNDKYLDVAFTGDTVTVPILKNAQNLMVGVYAGDLSTTTPAKIPCTPSILCVSGEAKEPDYQENNGKIEYRLPMAGEEDDGKILSVEGGAYVLKSPDETAFGVQSVEESNEDGGSNIVTFTDGKTMTVKNGSKGADGKDGNDYVLTDDDKSEIAELAKGEVATSIDLSAFDSTGQIVETYADGTTKTTTVVFDDSGNPTKITDSDGNETVLTW